MQITIQSITSITHQSAKVTVDVSDSGTGEIISLVLSYTLSDVPDSVENITIPVTPGGYGEYEVILEGLLPTATYDVLVTGMSDDTYVSLISTFTTLMTYPVQFELTFDDAPLANAEISISNQDTLTTDAEGLANIDLPAGSYIYSISKPGYQPINNKSFVISIYGMKHSLQLQKLPDAEPTDITDKLLLVKADYDFIAGIINFIKQNQKLPLNVTSDDVIFAIQQHSDWFYEYAMHATTEDILVFHTNALSERPDKYLKDLDTDADVFQLTGHSVLMPYKCQNVYELWYSTAGFAERTAFSYSRWQLENMLMSTAGMHGFAGIDTYFASVYVGNTMTSAGKEAVNYEYNHLQKILKVYDLGNRTGYIYGKVLRRIPLQSLYRDLYYKRYIAGNVLLAIADNKELFDSKLPGNLNLNPGIIRDRGQKLIDMVEEFIQNDLDNDNYIIRN